MFIYNSSPLVVVNEWDSFCEVFKEKRREGGVQGGLVMLDIFSREYGSIPSRNGKRRKGNEAGRLLVYRAL